MIIQILSPPKDPEKPVCNFFCMKFSPDNPVVILRENMPDQALDITDVKSEIIPAP